MFTRNVIGRMVHGVSAVNHWTLIFAIPHQSDADRTTLYLQDSECLPSDVWVPTKLMGTRSEALPRMEAHLTLLDVQMAGFQVSTYLSK